MCSSDLLGAALALTKINVGAFMLFSGFAWLAFRQESPAWRRRGVPALILWLLVMPWILMAKKLGEGPTLTFALLNNVAVLGIAAVLLHRRAGEPARGSSIRAYVLGAAGLTFVTVVVTLLRGSSVLGILSGVLLDPLNQPNVYSFPVEWQSGHGIVYALGFALAVWASFRPENVLAVRAIIAARLLAAAGFLLVIVQLITTRGLAGFGLSYGLGLAAVCAVPLRHDPEGQEDARLRQWLAVLFMLQSLHAYPVAGSQLNWATFLWVPLLALAVRDAVLSLPQTWMHQPRFIGVGTGAVWAIGAYMAFNLGQIGYAKRSVGEPLALPGAEQLKPSNDTVYGLQIMAENAKAHSDLLYSMPGLYSFNLWTGLPTPTLDNATQWFLSLNEARQTAIREKLRADPRAALIVQKDTLKFLVDHGFRVRGALGNYLGTQFQQAFEVDGYAFWVRRGRTIAPLSTGKAFVGSAVDRTRLELVLTAPKQPIARIELWKLGAVSRDLLQTLTPANASLAATPIDAAGDPTGLALGSAWSGPLPAPIVRLTAEFPGLLEQPGQVLATAFAADGTRLAAIRILP